MPSSKSQHRIARIWIWLEENIPITNACKENLHDAGSWCNSWQNFPWASVSPGQALVGALWAQPGSARPGGRARPRARSRRLDSHDADRDPSKLFTALLSASQSQNVLPAKDMLSLSLSRRDQGSQRQPKVEDAVGATLSRSWQENTEPYSSAKPHKLHIFRKTDRNWKLQLCLIGGEEQKENLAPRRNAERGNVSAALEPLLRVFCCRWTSFHPPVQNVSLLGATPTF